MAVLFSRAPGSVVQLDTGQELIPFTISLEGWGGYASTKAIIQQIAIQAQGSYQFLHTLQDFIHAYTFGDRISPFTVSGLCFLKSCDGGGTSGIESAIAYYNSNRIAARATPVKLGLGSTGVGSFEGFLTSATFELADPELQLGRFMFGFHAFPSAAARAGNDSSKFSSNKGGGSKSGVAKNGNSSTGVRFSSSVGAFRTVTPSAQSTVTGVISSGSGFIGIVSKQ